MQNERSSKDGKGSNKFGKRDDKKSFGKRDDKKSFGKRDGEKSFGKRDGEKPFGKRDGEKSFGKRDGEKTFGKRDGEKTFGKRDGEKSFGKRDDKKNFGKNEAVKKSKGKKVFVNEIVSNNQDQTIKVECIGMDEKGNGMVMIGENMYSVPNLKIGEKALIKVDKKGRRVITEIVEIL